MRKGQTSPIPEGSSAFNNNMEGWEAIKENTKTPISESQEGTEQGESWKSWGKGRLFKSEPL